MTAPASAVRVAVVGTGAWWGREHLRAFSSRGDTVLCAVVGRTPDKTRARAEEFGIPGYVDLHEMLDRERPDLVAMTLPNEGHFEPTLAVIRAGVPLFVEKPLVFDLGEADQLLREAADRELFFAINFNHRYATPVRLAARAVRDGTLGPVVFATWRFGGEPGTSSHPHANLIETQCHGLDLLEHLCGPIDSVAAQMTDMTGRGFSTLVVALHFAGGGVGSLVGSYDSSYAYPGTHHLEVNGTQARLVVTDTVKRFELSRAGEETATTWEAGYFNDTERSFSQMFDRHLDEVIPALRTGGPPPIHGRAGRRALALAHAVIESHDTGRRVDTGDGSRYGAGLRHGEP
jgi:predicted dehydrogenase